MSQQKPVNIDFLRHQPEGKGATVTKKVENPEKRTNIDRHLCKSCIYRGSRVGLGRCNYIAVEGHSRGMPAAECTVYVKGRKRKGLW